jgi:protein TonB
MPNVRRVCAFLSVAWLPAVVAADEEPTRLPPVEVRAAYPLVAAQYRETPLPVYPSAAREQGLEGVALFDVMVQSDGRVGEVRLKRTSGSPLLDDAALATIKTWSFVPARRGPRAVESWVEVPVKFSLTVR